MFFVMLRHLLCCLAALFSVVYSGRGDATVVAAGFVAFKWMDLT